MICVYCFHETNKSQCHGFPTVDKNIFLSSADLEGLKHARAHWESLSPDVCGGEQFKDDRLNKFNEIINMLQK